MRKIPFNSQVTGKNTLLLVSLLILILVLFFSSFTTYSNYVALPIMALWILFITTLVKRLSKTEIIFVRVSFLFLSVMLLYWLIGYSNTETVGIFRNVTWIMTGIIAVCVVKNFSSHELSVVYSVLTISITILLFVLVSTGRLILMVGEQEDAVEVANAWYGSLFMLFTGMSLIVFLHVKSIVPRIISIAIFLLTLYLNFTILQRGTNVLFTIAEIGMILAFSLKQKGLVYFISAVVLGSAIFIYTSGMLIDMFDWLADNSPSARLAKRFNYISTALFYEDIQAGGGSFSARQSLIGISWDTFTSSIGHFIFGAGEQHADNTVIGHHSFFIDTLARYGIIGGVMIFVYFKTQYQIIMINLDKKIDWALYMQCAVVFLFYVLRNFYGQLAYALVNFVILLFFPLTFQLIQYYKNKS